VLQFASVVHLVEGGEDFMTLRIKKKDNAIPVTVCEGPQGCEMSRLPHFLDSWFTDDGEVVSLMCQSPFTPKNISGTDFS
jgi:hypothetical protein